MPAKISISIRKHHPLDIIDIDSEREKIKSYLHLMLNLKKNLDFNLQPMNADQDGPMQLIPFHSLELPHTCSKAL
jgi:hypothetical protein